MSKSGTSKNVAIECHSRRARAGVACFVTTAAIVLGGCMLQQPLPRNQQPVLGTATDGRPNLNPVLAPGIIQDDVAGRPPESLNSLPRGSEVNRPLTPQAGQINTVPVTPVTR